MKTDQNDGKKRKGFDRFWRIETDEILNTGNRRGY